jgi:hypothetical protein
MILERHQTNVMNRNHDIDQVISIYKQLLNQYQ